MTGVNLLRIAAEKIVMGNTLARVINSQRETGSMSRPAARFCVWMIWFQLPSTSAKDVRFMGGEACRTRRPDATAPLRCSAGVEHFVSDSMACPGRKPGKGPI